MTVLTIIYCIFNIIIKIIDIVIVLTVAWRHVGLCYINYSIKIIVICLAVAEILVLVVQIVVNYRRRMGYKLREQLSKDKY